jgi:hypothetical protein
MCSWLCSLRKRLRRFLGCCPKLGSVKWSLFIGAIKVSGEGTSMAMTIPVDFDGTIKVKAAFVDSKGNPARVDGFPTFSSSDDELLYIDVDPNDKFAAIITLKDRVGVVQIKAVADADLGEGVSEVILLGDIELVAGTAVGGKLEVILSA